MKYLVIALLLAGCTTPLTTLRGPDGRTESCGGNTSSSVAGGVVGYHIQKEADRRCVELLRNQGYEVVSRTAD